jgi:thiamine kinase-like enzyme
VKNEFIESVVLKVYPRGAIFTSGQDNVPLKHRFWTISVGGRPRWIVPQLPKLGLPALRQWRPYGALSCIKWQALLAIYRLGLLGYLPNVQSFGIFHQNLLDWDHVFWDYPEPPTVIIYIGTPGVTSKAVVTLARQDTGRPTVIMKIPLGIKAAASIAQESFVLKDLENHKHKVSPRLLHYDINSGWSFQEAINGSSVAMRFTESHYDFLCKLNTSTSFVTLAELSASLSRRLNKLSSLSFDEHQILNRTLQQIYDETPITAGWVHGDFAPWNLKWTNKKVLIAVDWEFSEWGGPIGLDLIHYHCRINGIARSGDCSSLSFESGIINRMRMLKSGLCPTSEPFLKQLIRYYLVWYQVVLEEHGIVDSTKLDYQRITKELLNESL